MLKRRLLNVSWCKFQSRRTQSGNRSLSVNYGQYDLENIRNVGILAHVDAGKTTTTERMLYYAGVIKAMGEVHHGNTVTDYMEQERERGITITSAAVSFGWKKHCINLIDTPGHIDFTGEIEQSLHVMDGVVIILDGSAGVEAQTTVVNRQADKHNLPKIFFVNKMDRTDADINMNLDSIRSKLNAEPLLTQLPIKDNGVLKGIVDVVSLDKLIYNTCTKTVQRTPLTEQTDGALWEMASESRTILTDKLSDLDDTLANTVIQLDSLAKISNQSLVDSIHKVTLHRQAVPVLLGSAYKNIGVQALMDGILLYLPSSNLNQYSQFYAAFGENFCARIFKVVHDPLRGPLVFARIYSGSLRKGDKLYNNQEKAKGVVTRIYAPLANEYKEITEVGAGHIIAIGGIQKGQAGDLVTHNSTTTHNALKKLTSKKNISDDDVKKFFSSQQRLEPVFFCTIEPPSTAYQSLLEIALNQLQREDLSLTVQQDLELGQHILGGMGELHINIIKDRLKREYKIDADLGPLQIAYKETLQNPVKDTYVSTYKIGKKAQSATVTLSLIPNHNKKDILQVDRSPEAYPNAAVIPHAVLQAVKNGVTTGLAHGPILSCPVINVGVMLHHLEVASEASKIIISATVSQCIRKLLNEGNVRLMEPIMWLEVITQEEYATGAIADLSKRRAEIQNISLHRGDKVIECLVPLSEMSDYSTTFRVITSGRGTFSMRFDHYRLMDSVEQAAAVKKVTGF